MSAVNVMNVAVLDNPSMFLNPFQFEISYEYLVPLKDDLTWKLIYVASAEDEKYDQVLETVLVGPMNVGNYRFVFQTDPPKPSKIPEEDIMGVTVLLLTCSYVGQKLLRVGYYVSNEYVDEVLREEPPAKVLIDRLQRNILADKPRVTKFPIVFNATPVPEVAESSTSAANMDYNPMVEVPMYSAPAPTPMYNVPTAAPMYNAPAPVTTDAELDEGGGCRAGVRPMESTSPVCISVGDLDDGLGPMESCPPRHEQWKASLPIEFSS